MVWPGLELPRQERKASPLEGGSESSDILGQPVPAGFRSAASSRWEPQAQSRAPVRAGEHPVPQPLSSVANVSMDQVRRTMLSFWPLTQSCRQFLELARASKHLCRWRKILKNHIRKKPPSHRVQPNPKWQ